MNPFETENPAIKNVVIVAHTFGQRPSDILRDLYNSKFSAEEALEIDVKSVELINQMNAAADSDNISEKDRLQAKWQAEDIKIKQEMERRKISYNKLQRKFKK